MILGRDYLLNGNVNIFGQSEIIKIICFLYFDQK